MPGPGESGAQEEPSRRTPITFLTDFGLDWGPVGVCHAVMRNIAPGVEIVDISHGIPPFDVRAGAWVLASTLPYAVVGIHVAVVDPGVGTTRLPLALSCRRGDVLIGPDNGLLLPVAERLGGVAEARELTNAVLWRHPVSHTFHGRDIFAPTAAHLASGVPFPEVGPMVEAMTLVSPPWVKPEYGDREVRGEVVLIDTFGNVRTNIESARWPLEPGGTLLARTVKREHSMQVARTFGEVAQGALFAYEDSSGYVCLAQNLGSAAAALDTQPGTALLIRRTG